MSQVTSCDGCGQVQGEEETFFAYGVTETLEYCVECCGLVDSYLCERDELHTRLAEEFQDDVQALIHAWIADRPNGKLPDFRRTK